MVKAAASAGFSITGCAQATSSCFMSSVQRFCPETCGMCPVSGCVDNDAGVRTFASGFGVSINGCAQVLANCASETIANYCPVTCGQCSNSSN
eukprot:TRINITY_DN1999_c0_g1_i1.p1 TRINITY_DN1999_c0_g1~~TRINITY_DN1999_c0_g1_i1.p1  ORF type:complete len:106 (+),score=15.80 TRINITY_DN1999_c0_g1_i1:40-318(+)